MYSICPTTKNVIKVHYDVRFVDEIEENVQSDDNIEFWFLI